MATWSGDRKVWGFLATANSPNDDDDSNSKEAWGTGPVNNSMMVLSVMSSVRSKLQHVLLSFSFIQAYSTKMEQIVYGSKGTSCSCFLADAAATCNKCHEYMNL